MTKDPIVQEVREVREQHARRYRYNLHAICTDLRKREKEYKKKYGHPVVSMPPRSRVDKKFTGKQRTK